jgi:hypothetical protein
LSELLAVAAPQLPPELVSADTLAALTTLAAPLPPLRAVGLECRLAAGDGEVDLQLGASADHGYPAALVRFLRAAPSTNAAWQRVLRLGEAWATEGTAINEAVSELWLEFDKPADARTTPPRLADLTPSVFTVLRPPADGDRSAGLRIAQALVELLVDDPEPLGAVLERCAAACPAPAQISHIGLMLGRPVPVMRVHLSPVPLDHLTAFLTELGWPGDSAAAYELAQSLLVYGDLVVVCLDVVGDVLPRIGLEVFFAQKHGVDPRWAPLLDGLVALGVASPVKADALRRWPGGLLPPQLPDAWPDSLIVEGLAKPANTFGVIERRLSHIKLTWAPGVPVSAKAYFGAGHVWQVLGEPVAPAAETALVQLPSSTSRSLDEAIDAAVARLLAARNQGGWWRDFFDRGRPAHVDRRVTGYASDEWVTAYVAAVLAAGADPRGRAAASHALDLLLARPRTGGWGYHALLPPDADTTTWVLRLARDLGAAETERLARARRFVTGLIGRDGGVATYEPAAARPLAEFLRMDGTYAGWCGTHACVTAAAAGLDLDPRVRDFLLRAQRPDGSWAGHWWDDDEYTTARAAEALAIDGRHADAVERARTWAVGRMAADGGVRSVVGGAESAFATALTVQAALVGGDPGAAGSEAVARAARWLIGHQRSDGSWAPSARLRVPGPDVVDPLSSPETTLTYVDDDAVFTTATALAALSAVAAGRCAATA